MTEQRHKTPNPKDSRADAGRRSAESGGEHVTRSPAPNPGNGDNREHYKFAPEGTPHPCETCEYWQKDKAPREWICNKANIRLLTYPEVSLIRTLGCASHSSRTSAPATPDDPIESRFLTKREAWEAGYDDAAGQILIENQLRAKQQNKPPAPSADAILVIEQCEDCQLNGSRLCMYHGYPIDTIPPICDYRIVDIDRDEYCIQQLRQSQQHPNGKQDGEQG